MASKREQVLDAVLALIKSALPNADVVRNRAKAKSIGPGGSVLIDDGEPGEAEVDLSPLTYNYTHRIPLAVGGYESASLSPEKVLDGMFVPIGAAVAADRTLGGLCQWVEVEAPDTSALDVTGAPGGRWGETNIIAFYDTPSPL